MAAVSQKTPNPPQYIAHPLLDAGEEAPDEIREVKAEKAVDGHKEFAAVGRLVPELLPSKTQ